MQIKNRLRLFDLIMIVIGLVIGMGIFRTSRDAASAALTPAIYFSAWIFGGIVATCGALTFAEIGSRFPVTGAFYKIFSYAYHPSLAFAFNVSMLISNAASISAVALIGAGYILPIFVDEPSQLMAQLVAVSAIIIFFFINLKGLRLSSGAQNILMIIKILMLLVIISGVVYTPAHATSNTSLFAKTAAPWQEWITSFGVALVAVSFTFGGYQQTINFGSDVHNARNNMPKGILVGIATIIVLYLLTNISYYLVIGFEEMKTTPEIASVVVSRLFGDTGATVFSSLLFLSVLSYVNANLLSNPRVMYAMSEDGALPRIFGRKDERRGAYPVSLMVYALISVLIVFFAQTFERILSFSIFLDCFGMATSASTIFVLRRKTKNLDGEVYKMRLYPWLPLIFIAAYIFIGIIISVDTPLIALSGIAVLVVSGLLYFVIKR